MTVEEAKERRKELEEKLFKEILKFESDTRVVINQIKLHRTRDEWAKMNRLVGVLVDAEL